jgi:dinuclear metal center YbgI/SA1388 family protein
MLRVKEIAEYLNSLVPHSYGEPYDNLGLILGDENACLSGILVCLDVTEAVLKEAIDRGCNLVISHHPLIFSPIKKINNVDYVDRCITYVLKNDLCVYALHTNLDSWGLNRYLAGILSLHNLRALKPLHNVMSKLTVFSSSGHQNDDVQNAPDHVGFGALGELSCPMDFAEFISYLKSKLGLSFVRHSEPLDRPVMKVALCTGSGRELISNAINLGADLFITSDLKYHDFFVARDIINLIDIGHYEGEVCVKELIFEILCNRFDSATILKCATVTNPVVYSLK